MEKRVLLLKSKQIGSFFLRMSIVVFIIVAGALISNAYGQCSLTGNTSVCPGTSNIYTTDAGYSNYNWSYSAGGTVTAGGGTGDNSVTITWNTAGTQSVSVSSSGCEQATLLVYVLAVQLPIISGPTSVCAYSTQIYTTPSTITNYHWTVTGGNDPPPPPSGNISITVQWGSGPSGSVSITGTESSHGCVVTSAPYNVMIHALPVPTISGPTSVCAYSTQTYTTEPSMSNYVWTVYGGTDPPPPPISGNSFTVHWGAAGAGIVTVTYIDPTTGCNPASPTTLNVTINSLPVPTITGPTSVCANSTQTYTTQPGMTNYIWTVTGGTDAPPPPPTGNSISINWGANGTGNLTVTYTDPNGCNPTSAGSLNVTINPLPVPTITGPTPVCANSTQTYYAQPANMTSISWAVTGGTDPPPPFPTTSVTWGSGPSGSLMVTGMVNGCAGTSAPFNVTINPLPTPTITGPSSVCVNSTGNIYTTQSGSGINSYQWVITGGTITSGIGTNSITVTWTTTGPQTISVNYTNSFGCTAASPTVYNVTVNALPVPTISGDASACVNSTGHVYTTQGNMTNYIWNVSAGGTITAGGTATSNTVTVTWNTAGAQTVRVNYANSFGCTAASPTVYNVTVNALPAPIISGDVSACVNSTGHVYTTQGNMTNYIWNVSAGGTITTGGTATSSTVTVTWNTAGARTVSVNYANSFGCTAASPTVYNVTVNALPTPVISGPKAACANSTGNVYSTPVAGRDTYSWAITSGSITAGGGTNSITVTWGAAGTGTLTVTETTAAGCVVTTSAFSVTINPLPAVTINQSNLPDFCQGEYVVLTANASEDVTYLWSTQETTQTIHAGATNNYSVTVTDNNGCRATASIAVNMDITGLLSSYLMVADNQIELHGTTISSGGLGVLTSHCGHIHLSCNTNVTAPGTFAKAPVIQVDNDSHLTTAYYTPAVVSLPPFELNTTNSNVNIQICDNKTKVLNGSVYGNIEIGNNSTVIFTAAVIDVKQLHLHQNATVKFTQCSKMRLQNNLVVEDLSNVNPDALGVIFYVTGDVIFDGGIHANGVFYCAEVEHGVVSLEHLIQAGNSHCSRPGQFNGMFLAEEIHSDMNNYWNINPLCSNCTPPSPPPTRPPCKIAEEEIPPVDGSQVILRNYPNPFTGKTNVVFILPADDHVKIDVFDVSGKLVQTIFNDNVKMNQEYKVEFDGTMLVPGIYFYKLTANGEVYMNKMMLVK
jgi:hypothetical protein